jgi:glutamyl-tRNA synthetase
VKWETEYFFDEWYSFDKSSLKETYPNLSESDISNILAGFKETYDSADSKEIWFEKVKTLCDSIWFASNIKEYKKAPENFKGSIVEVTTILRLFLTGKTKTPDMYYIMQVLWKIAVFERLSI